MDLEASLNFATNALSHDLSEQLGSGEPRVHLSNVNGPISMKRGYLLPLTIPKRL